MMIANWLGGMAIGVVCASLLLAFDIAGIRTLLWRSDMPIAGTAMLMLSFAFSFGGLVCAAAVMRAGDDDDDKRPPGGGRRFKLAPQQPRLAFATIPAHSRAHRSR